MLLAFGFRLSDMRASQQSLPKPTCTNCMNVGETVHCYSY